MSPLDRAAAKLDRVIAERNGGNYPRTRREFVRTAERMDFAVCFSPTITEESACVLDGVIYVPEIATVLLPVHRHELREAAALWSGCAPYVAPASRHDLSCIDLAAPPLRLTRLLSYRISRLAGKMAILLEQAGLDHAHVWRRPDSASGYGVSVDYDAP